MTTDARPRLLEAALAVFTRFGYRKTSMEEVARAAGVSRQGLYLHFPTKEELFRETLIHTVEGCIAAANAVADNAELDTENKLVQLFDALIGRYVGILGESVTDLHEATTMFGSDLGAYEARFVELVTKVIRGSKLPAAYKALGLSARELVDSLHATAKGLKMIAKTRDEFCDRFRVAVRVMCQPLR